MDMNELIRCLSNEYNMFKTREKPKVRNIEKNEIIEIASLANYDSFIQSLRKDNKLIWHVAAPKSGSTWLSNVVSDYLSNQGWATPTLFSGSKDRAQDIMISEIARLKIIEKNIFAQHQHCLCSDYAINTIKKFDIKLVIQVRNIYDSLISLKDHLDMESTKKPLFFLNDSIWNELDNDEKMDFLISFAAPWYITFWAGWEDAVKNNNISHTVINYSDLISNFEASVTKVLDLSGTTSHNIEYISSIKNSVFSRKNVGREGRGKVFTTNQKGKIKSLTKFYRNTDFSYLGI